MCKTAWSADLQALPGAAAEPTPGDPSLFVGGNGTRTGLHTDYASSHFWMLTTEGKKDWAVFPAQMAPFLYKGWSRPFFPVNPWALEKGVERRPLSAVARGFKGSTQPGDVIFVPGGSIHAVRNTRSPTVALSMNYVDDTAVEQAAHDLARNPRGEADEELGRALARRIGRAGGGGDGPGLGPGRPLWEYKGVPRAEWLGSRRGEL